MNQENYGTPSNQLLVAIHVSPSERLHFTMHLMYEEQTLHTEVTGVASTPPNPIHAMGIYLHGLHYGPTSQSRVHRDSGYCGPPHQSRRVCCLLIRNVGHCHGLVIP